MDRPLEILSMDLLVAMEVVAMEVCNWVRQQVVVQLITITIV